MDGRQELLSKWPALSLTAIGGLLRVLPHPPNLAPVGAMSLFAGANLNGWQAYLVPLLIMALTDPILGMTHGFAPFSKSTVFIYGSFLISVRIGRQLGAKQSVSRIGAAAFLCAFVMRRSFAPLCRLSDRFPSHHRQAHPFPSPSLRT